MSVPTRVFAGEQAPAGWQCSPRALSSGGQLSSSPKSHPGLGWGGALGMQSSTPLPIPTHQLPAQGQSLPPEQLRPDSLVTVESLHPTINRHQGGGSMIRGILWVGD